MLHSWADPSSRQAASLYSYIDFLSAAPPPTHKKV